MAGQYKTDRWFTSPFNYVKEVQKQFTIPKKIQFHDVTLRDGEQQTGIVFNKEDKVRIAEALAEAGCQRIEAGMPVVSPEDEAAVREIVKRKLGPQIFAFCRCTASDVKLAVDCGVDGVVLEIPVSSHLTEKAYRWTRERAIAMAIEATSLAHENGLYTVFFGIDGTRAEPGELFGIIDKVNTQGHMDSFVVVDTFGAASFHAMTYLVSEVKKRLSKPVEVHCHNDLGLGTANTLAALLAGAEVAHTSISAIGERAGNVSFEETALILQIMYGVNTGIKTEKFCELSRLLREITGISFAPNRPIVGYNTTCTEAGVSAMLLDRMVDTDPLELMPFHWELVGQQKPRVALGKKSGTVSIRIWLNKIGKTASDEEIAELLSRVKDKSFANRGVVTEEQFRQLVDDVCRKSRVKKPGAEPKRA